MAEKPTAVVNTSYPPERVDLNDGRVLAPGANADNVDLQDPHNAMLMEAGKLAVFTGEREEG